MEMQYRGFEIMAVLECLKLLIFYLLQITVIVTIFLA